MRRTIVALLAIITVGFIGTSTAAQTYPVKPVRLMVAFPPGGPNDLIARVISPKLAELIKQPVIVENRAGAGGAIATEAVIRMPADGYTLLFNSNGALAIGPLLSNVSYDVLRDLAPIARIASNPMLLVAHSNVRAKTIPDLIAFAKANPGKLNFASAGAGSPTHLAIELLQSMANVRFTHVPYKGGGPAMADLIGGQVDYYFGGLTTALPHVKTGKLRAIALTSAARSAVAPDIPSIAEEGLAGYDASIWYGILAPAGTPPGIIEFLHDAIIRVVRTPEIRSRLIEQGADTHENGPEAFAALINTESAKWARIIQQAGIKAE
ncbi:MAG: tripartite tricarboxylate transporter substrate binding protein [Betaproteobacteria bacterium]|nr:tripartite tricarboxylate transporter substrate binding protein [Betaproteobacteria bacterium]